MLHFVVCDAEVELGKNKSTNPKLIFNLVLIEQQLLFFKIGHKSLSAGAGAYAPACKTTALESFHFCRT